MRNVLVIDDDPEHAEIVAALLKRRGFDVSVAPDTFAVYIDNERIEASPAEELPMAQRYFLF